MKFPFAFVAYFCPVASWEVVRGAHNALQINCSSGNSSRADISSLGRTYQSLVYLAVQSVDHFVPFSHPRHFSCSAFSTDCKRAPGLSTERKIETKTSVPGKLVQLLCHELCNCKILTRAVIVKNYINYVLNVFAMLFFFLHDVVTIFLSRIPFSTRVLRRRF